MDEESIFLQAVMLDSVADRAAYLDRACGSDPALRDSVESLLAHHSAIGNFLEAPPAELQRTFVSGQGDTVDDGARDRTLELLDPCDKPGCIGRLGSYEIIEVIGRGGMGAVFRARDPKLHRDVALKVLSASSTTAAKRFLREARAAAAVKHDHVVTIYAVHDEGRSPYIVMELVEGVSLQDRIDSGPLPSDEIVRIGLQIAAGLEAAHSRGLVHRDVKPANILLEAGSNRVKITDFGLARAIDDGQITREGQIAGTPQFMSPEQAQGRPTDHRSDLFSLGSVLYVMCAGRPAFAADSWIATLRGICDDSPLAINSLNKDIPAALAEIVRRLLEKDPEKRPRSAGEVIAELVRVSPAPIHRKANNPKPWTTWAFAGGGILALAAVVILVVNRNGKTHRYEVPDDAHVKVNPDGNVEIELPESKLAKRPLATGPARQAVEQLMQLNPEFDGQVESMTSGDEIVELRFSADHVKDLSPLKSLTSLERLSCAGSGLRSGVLKDLSPLSGLKLRALDVANTQVTDLMPLAGMPLERINLANSNVADLTPLADIPLVELYVQGTRVKDLAPLPVKSLGHLNISQTSVTSLTPLKSAKLISLFCDETKIDDFSPLAGMPLLTIHWRGYDQTSSHHLEVLRSIKTLETIDSRPVDEFFKN